MKVSEFIKWLEQKDQNLEVYVLEVNEEVCYGYDGENSYSEMRKFVSEVSFDSPEGYVTETKHYLTLGIER